MQSYLELMDDLMVRVQTRDMILHWAILDCLFIGTIFKRERALASKGDLLW